MAALLLQPIASATWHSFKSASATLRSLERLMNERSYLGSGTVRVRIRAPSSILPSSFTRLAQLQLAFCSQPNRRACLTALHRFENLLVRESDPIIRIVDRNRPPSRRLRQVDGGFEIHDVPSVHQRIDGVVWLHHEEECKFIKWNEQLKRMLPSSIVVVSNRLVAKGLSHLPTQPPVHPAVMFETAI
jgi:hypothetical protein